MKMVMVIFLIGKVWSTVTRSSHQTQSLEIVSIFQMICINTCLSILQNPNVEDDIDKDDEEPVSGTFIIGD